MSSYMPAMSATWPGRLSVGTLVWLMPQVPRWRAASRRYGAANTRDGCTPSAGPEPFRCVSALGNEAMAGSPLAVAASR